MNRPSPRIASPSAAVIRPRLVSVANVAGSVPIHIMQVR